MRRGFYFLVTLLLIANTAFSQGVGIPSKRGGIGFGNLPRFTGVRFNFKDKYVEKITGMNVTVWQTKHDGDQTGTVNGISLGLPMAMGHANQNGISLGLLGVAATENLSGINVGVLGAGAGNSVNGFNFGGLGVGSGQDLRGVTIGGLGAGAGGDVIGFNVGGLGIGAGGNLAGFSFGGLGVGSGGNVSGVSLAGLGIGAGENLTGFSFAVGGIGAGQKIRGINIAGLGIGAGQSVNGINVAGLGVGGPRVTGVAVAMAVGGVDVKGIMIAPAFFRVGGGNNTDENGVSTTEDGVMQGLSVSAYNRIKGEQRGVAIGVVNYTQKIKGFQFGVINIVRDNPKGLRVLPIFNTRFGKKP
jgi:hypothetical protein